MTLDSPHLLTSFVEYMDNDGHLAYLQIYMILSGILDQVRSLLNEDKTSWIGDPDPLLIDDLKKLNLNYFQNDAPIEIDDQLLLDARKSIDELKASESLNNQSLLWLHLLKNVRLEVLKQMEAAYGTFTKSPTYKGQKMHEADDDDTPTPGVSMDIDQYRTILEDKEKFRKAFKITNLFKKNKKVKDEHFVPSRKDGMDNIESELNAIISSDEKIFSDSVKKTKKNSSATLSSQIERKPIQALGSEANNQQRRLSLDILLPKMVRSRTEPEFKSAISKKVPGSKSNSELNSLTFTETDDSILCTQEFDVNERIKRLETELEYLNQELEDLKKDNVDSKRTRQIFLMKRGLESELQQVITEKNLSAKEEGYESIFKVRYICFLAQ